MKPRHIASVLVATAILASPFFHVQACGPDFEPDTFVRTNLPDDLPRFTAGHLGIIQSGYDSDEYAIAFRYLSGGKLSKEEQAHITPPGNPLSYDSGTDYEAKREQAAAQQPAHLWLLKRAEYSKDPVPNQKESFPTEPYDKTGTIVFDPNYLNCPDPAFQNAVLTLDKRAATWGKRSPNLADWIKAQDTVFQNCNGKIPALPSAAGAGSPALLQADRAYQQASAALYARQYDQAAKQFQAIASDNKSPWAPWGKYLGARALIRKAFSDGKETNPYSGDLATYDKSTMLEAQHQLEALLQSPNPTPSREAVTHALNFIRIRTEPEKRTAEICVALAGPTTDPDFELDLADLNFLLIKHPDLKVDNPEQAPLLTWIMAWRHKTPPGTSLNLWHSTHAQPWLVTALADAAPTDSTAGELLTAAEKVASTSPAYETVLYHRIRLLMGRGKQEEARTLLDHQLALMPADGTAAPSFAHSDRNAYLRERFSVARDFPELLKYAPRRDLNATNSAASASEDQCLQQRGSKASTADCPVNQHPQEFDDDAVLVLSQRTPLAQLVEAATSPALPENLRQQLTLSTWTRAVLLNDIATAQKLTPLLPKSLKLTPETAIGFPAIVAILHNPGLRPQVEPGISRLDTISELDSFRDNWWCLTDPATKANPHDNGDHPDTPDDQPLPEPTFFTPDQKQLAAAQYKQLLAHPNASAWLGHQVLAYAKDHPTDPGVPEALYLVVRSTRYSCYIPDKSPAALEQTAVSKSAFQLLHSKYPNSPWTAKTPYYF